MAFKISDTIVIDNSQNIIIGSGTTAQRPAFPVAGTLWFNTSLGILEGWTGSIWEQLTLT
jgi:hypothetical protein